MPLDLYKNHLFLFIFFLHYFLTNCSFSDKHQSVYMKVKFEMLPNNVWILSVKPSLFIFITTKLNWWKMFGRLRNSQFNRKLLKEYVVVFFRMYKHVEVVPNKIHPGQRFENILKQHKVVNWLRIYT